MIDNRYTILESLGGGGVGEVFLAHDEVLGREVALKILARRYAGDEEFVERFKREARSTASLSHPNIVAVYDLGETYQAAEEDAGSSDEPTMYITMDYVPGTTLSDLIRERDSLPATTAATVALCTAYGLDAAHAHDIIHRDIKPGNILLSGDIAGENESLVGPSTVKVADFGIARRLTENTLTEKNAIMGTALYLSPEQAQGKRVGPQSDLYSLGVVLYEMLTGRRPFEAGEMESPLALAMKHVNETPKAPIELNPDVPPELNDLTLSLLSKDPEERPESATVLAQDLERIIKDAPDSPLQSTGNRADKTKQEDDAASRIADTILYPNAHTPAEEQIAGRNGNRKYVALAAALSVMALLLIAAVTLGNFSLRDVSSLLLPKSSGTPEDESEAEVTPQPVAPTTTETTPVSEPLKTTVDEPIEEKVRQAVRDYYDAVDRQNWAYTYENLGDRSREMFTEDEWYRKNQWFADRENLDLASVEVNVNALNPSNKLARVNVYRTFESGTVIDRNTVFVYEDGTWKHRLVGSELVFFRPDATYEEFVEAQRDG